MRAQTLGGATEGSVRDVRHIKNKWKGMEKTTANEDRHFTGFVQHQSLVLKCTTCLQELIALLAH